MSSSDGFCSTLAFSPGELGQPYVPSATAPQGHVPGSDAQPAQASPKPTPAQPATPAVVKGPTATPARQSVGSRSSSNDTEVVNNPTPIMGSVPLVTATNSAQPQTLPLTTPPETPLQAGVSHSTASSVSSVLGKRDLGGMASESEKEDTKGEEKTRDNNKQQEGNESQQQEQEQQQQQPTKKRRIAPTLISGPPS